MTKEGNCTQTRKAWIGIKRATKIPKAAAGIIGENTLARKAMAVVLAVANIALEALLVV